MGHSIDDNTIFKCKCGCVERLKIGSIIANKMRQHLLTELSITCTAGIGHNKLLAKLAGQQNKPNMQTTIFPTAVQQFLSKLNHVRLIPGIGHATEKKLNDIGLNTIDKLRYASIETLKISLGVALAEQVKNWCLGIDESDLNVIDKVKSIGCEDTIQKVFSREDVMKAIHTILLRVWNLVLRDGRLPSIMKLTVRTKNFKTERNERSSREISFDNSFLGKITTLNVSQEKKMMSIAESLLQKMINKDPFELNLVGLSFSNFQDDNKRKTADLHDSNENTTNSSSNKQNKISNFFKKVK
jgi:nucleotidyltransferase/DNA polymerase involved in DNA repair